MKTLHNLYNPQTIKRINAVIDKYLFYQDEPFEPKLIGQDIKVEEFNFDFFMEQVAEYLQDFKRIFLERFLIKG